MSFGLEQSPSAEDRIMSVTTIQKSMTISQERVIALNSGVAGCILWANLFNLAMCEVHRCTKKDMTILFKDAQVLALNWAEAYSEWISAYTRLLYILFRIHKIQIT